MSVPLQVQLLGPSLWNSIQKDSRFPTFWEMRYTFNFNSFLKQSNDDGSGIGVVRGTGRQCQHLISSSIFFVGCEYILIYVLCIFFYMSRHQSQTARRLLPVARPTDSSVLAQPDVRALAGPLYFLPLPSRR